MTVRCGVIFTASDGVMMLVAVIGGGTALFAATIALVQHDMKRILAYSTISQLGYMFLGVGVFAASSAIFHLFTHAFFKALLFLAAGSVMHAMGGIIDVRRIDETDGYFDKSLEIVKTLHRSPDYLILGEIQTAEHSQALFQAIAAGLRAMQTCHSYSAASLVSRWTTGHDIEKSSIAMMDLIVTMVRPVPGESSRRVSEIVEVRRTVSEGVLEFTGLSTVYNYHSSQDLQWTSDGAFLSYARETGHESHIKAYDAIVDLLTRSLQTSSNDAHRDLGKDIWSLERPLWFAGV